MSTPFSDADDLTRLIGIEAAVDRAHAAAQARQRLRQGGVAWSGLSPEPSKGRTSHQSAAAARSKLEALKAWRAAIPGRFLEAVAESQRAAALAHAAGEYARAALSRSAGEDVAGCIAAADEMAAQALAASLAARRALQVARCADAPAPPCPTPDSDIDSSAT